MLATRRYFFIAVFLFISFSHYYFFQIGDDSFIYFRYVEQTLSGSFGQWTSQLPPVEGYSSPLWFLLLTSLSAIGVPVIWGAKCLGLACMLFTCVLVWQLAKQLSDSTQAADTALLLTSLSAGFYYWGLSGLETPLYTLLYVSFAWALLTDKPLFILAGLIALVGVTRPEGMFLAPLLALFVSFYLPVLTSSSLHRRVLFVLAALSVPLLWLTFRLSYYGQFLPNTFYAKATGDALSQILKGFQYSLPVLLVCAALLVYACLNRQAKLLALLLLVALLSAFVVGGGGDWMFHFRLWQPIVPLVFVALAVTLFQVIIAKQWWAAGLLLMTFLPSLLLFSSVADIKRAIQFQHLESLSYQEGDMTLVSKVVAKAIAQQASEQGILEPLVAVNHAGAIPYYLVKNSLKPLNLNEAYFIDMVGLNDATIAHSAGDMHAKYDVRYVLASQPDFVVLNSRVSPGESGVYYHKGYWQGEDALFEQEDFQAAYEPAGITASWRWLVPWPMNWFYQGYDESWIIVYRRKQAFLNEG